MNMAQYKDYVEVLSLHEFEYGEGEITLSPYALSLAYLHFDQYDS